MRPLRTLRVTQHDPARDQRRFGRRYAGQKRGDHRQRDEQRFDRERPVEDCDGG